MAQYKQANDSRAKRLVAVEGAVDRLSKDMNIVKEKYKARLDELKGTMKLLLEIKDKLKRDVHRVSTTVSKVEKSYQNDVTGIL
ncbi:MAG: hypothetical protein V2I33_26235 [Kangiellaceae bacterium]|nr:hypothetical protein [Kangiellaceae bacterium]